MSQSMPDSKKPVEEQVPIGTIIKEDKNGVVYMGALGPIRTRHFIKDSTGTKVEADYE